ncbi:putative ABC transporter related protein (plasmid) [Selenomonas ruminantium subsp. lactilytica TAM6421]|uniref:Putative ABC transporter related protein n=1 Tax=Selenomonas ruminantium subsp. lactilytica (strain NBRC 103574 / TAM6421) TaxID=927704 RepID=I0GW04_SELRL|nr:transporter substrate-binding domain-containing protein [Selenomonas ruminantium]BAL84941.1 putative ABC transporter related protein [Selenomonas ruminantium subsp. lactilytica TAM6421]
MNVKLDLKKVVGVLVSCAFAGAVLAGCGLPENAAKNSDDKPVKLGMLTNMNISEQQQAAMMKEASQRGGFPAKMVFDITYYDNLNSMQMGLESKSVNEMSTYQCVADYLMARNDKFSQTEFGKAKLEDGFCAALREDDKELLEEMNKAINAMKDDGTLDKLAQEYIKNVKAGEEPPAVPLEKVGGRPTLKVAVTGDLPPIDLVLANGKPAGFNTAVLAEIGKRLQKNIEIVQVNSGARAAALSGKTVDVIFWAVVPEDKFNIRPADFDKPKGVATTVPYYKDTIVHIALKK